MHNLISFENILYQRGGYSVYALRLGSEDNFFLWPGKDYTLLLLTWIACFLWNSLGDFAFRNKMTPCHLGHLVKCFVLTSYFILLTSLFSLTLLKGYRVVYRCAKTLQILFIINIKLLPPKKCHERSYNTSYQKIWSLDHSNNELSIFHILLAF
jgi:hypothetical protein